MAHEKSKMEKFTWWMVDHSKWWPIQALAPFAVWGIYIIINHLAMTPLTALIFGYAFLMNIFLHEMGHAFLYRKNGLKTKIWWLFPFGAAAGGETVEEDDRSYTFPMWNLGWIALAGVIVNTILIAIGIFLMSVTNIFIYATGFALILNGAIAILFNLFPIAQIDGGLLFKCIVSSLDEQGSWVIAAIVTIVAIAILVVAFTSPAALPVWAIFHGAAVTVYIIGWTALSATMAIALLVGRKRLNGNPVNEKKMTFLQALALTLVAVFIFYFSLIVTFGI